MYNNSRSTQHETRIDEFLDSKSASILVLSLFSSEVKALKKRYGKKLKFIKSRDSNEYHQQNYRIEKI